VSEHDVLFGYRLQLRSDNGVIAPRRAERARQGVENTMMKRVVERLGLR
jgi:hypothetical protein